MALTNKQKAFINEYLVDFNATQAAIRAGYSEKTASKIGSENIRKPDIAEEISRCLNNSVMSAEEAMSRLADHARADMSDFIHVEPHGSWKLDLAKAAARGKLHLIKAILVTRQGPRIELVDPQRALETIIKHHGLAKDELVIHTPEIDRILEKVYEDNQDE